MKQWIGLILVGAILAAVAACSSSPEESSPVVSMVEIEGGLGGPAVRGDWEALSDSPNIRCGADDVEHADLGEDHDDRIPDEPWGASVRSPEGDRCGDDFETLLFRLANCERQARGLDALSCDERLVWAGRHHSRDMYERGYFSHVSPEGLEPGARLEALGIAWRASAENLAQAPTMAHTHSGWMESPGHRENILRPQMTHLGVGVVKTPEGYLMTALFATPQ